MRTMTIDDLFYELPLVAKVHEYSPARPAPHCSNPDHPAYSDPGDDEEINFDLYVESKNKKGEIILTKIESCFNSDLAQVIYDSVIDKVCQEARTRDEDRKADAIAEQFDMRMV